MSIAAPGSSPVDESLPAATGKRISELARIVFALSPERFVGGTNNQFDDVEPAELLAALRACSFYVIPRAAYTEDNTKIVQLEGNDGNYYVLRFSVYRPLISVQAARVNLASLSLDAGWEPREGPHFTIREIDFVDIMDEIPNYSRRLELGSVTIDRAFLIGMSLVISFMDDQGDDPDEDARLAPLSALVMPTEDELRSIWARKLPPSTINYDDEGEQPF